MTLRSALISHITLNCLISVIKILRYPFLKFYIILLVCFGPLEKFSTSASKSCLYLQESGLVLNHFKVEDDEVETYACIHCGKRYGMCQTCRNYELKSSGEMSVTHLTNCKVCFYLNDVTRLVIVCLSISLDLLKLLMFFILLAGFVSI